METSCTATTQQLKIAAEKTRGQNDMNEMNKKLINEVKDFFITVRTFIQRKPRNEQNMKLLELIDTLLRIDNLLDTEYEDLVDQLKDFDRGINLGIRHQFIKFKRSVLKLQVRILL